MTTSQHRGHARRVAEGLARRLARLGFPVLACLLGLAAHAPAVRAELQGRVESDDFASRELGARKRYLIYLPVSYQAEPTRRFPVAYYLHGAWGGETDWVSKGGLDVVMDSLVAAGMPEMIVVMPDGDDGFYTTWAPPFNRQSCPLRADLREPPAAYCVRTPRYDRYVADELVRHIDATYRTIADARHRGIGGLSMGGYGAMALAAQYPGVWSAAASHSGVLSLLALRTDSAAGTVEYAASPDSLRAKWPALYPLLTPVFGPDVREWLARDPARRLARLQADDPRRVPALYLDVGTGDDAYLLNTRAFRIELARLHLPFTYHEYPGRHDWTYWRAHLAQSLTWLADHIAR